MVCLSRLGCATMLYTYHYLCIQIGEADWSPMCRHSLGTDRNSRNIFWSKAKCYSRCSAHPAAASKRCLQWRPTRSATKSRSHTTSVWATTLVETSSHCKPKLRNRFDGLIARRSNHTCTGCKCTCTGCTGRNHRHRLQKQLWADMLWFQWWHGGSLDIGTNCTQRIPKTNTKQTTPNIDSWQRSTQFLFWSRRRLKTILGRYNDNAINNPNDVWTHIEQI